MAKRTMLTVFAALLVPLSLFSETKAGNSGGTLTFSANALHGHSTLVAYKAIRASSLGAVSFSTGSLASGSVQAGGTFNEGGGFVIVGNGTHGVPKGKLFVGKFTGTVTWTLITSPTGTHSYTLTGTVQSTDLKTDGTTIQLTVNVGTGYFQKAARLSGGDTSLNP